MRKRIEHKFRDDGTELKRCCHCKEWQELVCFGKYKNSWDCLSYQCKVCRHQYYEDNEGLFKKSKRIEHKIINSAEYKWCGICKQWKLLCDFNKSLSTWDKLDTRCRECSIQYYFNNRKYYIQQRKRRSKKFKAEEKQWRLTHKKQLAKYNKQWGVDNRDKRNATAAKRRVLKQNITLKNIDLELIEQYYSICVETNEILEGVYFHVDHIKPLSKGGLHHQNNLQILESTLNLEKNTTWPLNPEEKIKYKGFRI